MSDSARRRALRRHRIAATTGVGIGAPLLLSALILALFPTAASAHTSSITITCTQVQFEYQSFPVVTVTSHETVVVDSVEVAQRDVIFPGPSGIDTIDISLPSGTHTVVAADAWAFNGAPQGSATATQVLSDCGSTTTTTIAGGSTTTLPGGSTTTLPGGSTTTLPGGTTTTLPGGTTTTLPGGTTSTTIGGETSTLPGGGTTTTLPGGSTTTIGELGSTSTTSMVGEQGSTVPGESTLLTPTTLSGSLPFTGSSSFPLTSGLTALGIGTLAVGLASLRRIIGLKSMDPPSAP